MRILVVVLMHGIAAAVRLFLQLSFFFRKFHRRPKFSQMATAVRLGKSFKLASSFNGLGTGRNVYSGVMM